MSRDMLWRWVSTTAALFLAVTLIPGITHDGGLISLFLVAAVFGLVNATLKPLLALLTCPLILITFGLFALVINALMLLATSWLSSRWGLGFSVSGFWPAFFGGLLIGIVNAMLTARGGRQEAPG